MRESVRGVVRTARTAGLAALLLCGVARPVHAESALLPLVDPRLGPVVHRTIERAAARLADPSCAAVLHDFVDFRSGRPLAETLAATGRTPSEFLASLRFIDADHMAPCRLRTPWAWVPVGGDAVFVCKGRFLSLVKKSEWLAGNVLVHETLHALGLGENPPRSEEITEAVARRCGR